MFNSWARTFPPSIDVCPIEPPGRLVRRREKAAATVPEFVEALDSALADQLDLPFAMFGYSLGGLMAFEWCRAIRRRTQREPVQLIVAACSAPQLPLYYERIGQLSDAAFMRGFEQRYGAIDPALRGDPEMLEIVLAILRNDLRMLETYAHQEDRVFKAPILALGGADDRGVARNRLDAWQAHTSEPLQVEIFSGGHFFLRTRGEELARRVLETLEPAGAQRVLMGS